ncbi:hypothetical protein [Microvirga zambiensis]|uniref:hypothetical protein n=1 Tax=Microvirga zambiensis TaxID=1402137 RepID=UPI00191D4A3B|nr:hypothetical protein [Microvirga zambiensis]
MANFVPVSNAENVLFMVKRLEVETATSKSFGTGYHVAIFTKDQSEAQLFLVTNKHVVKDAKHIRVLMHTANGATTGRLPDGKYIYLEVFNPIGSIVNHTNPDVDLCAINLTPYMASWMSLNPGRGLYWKHLLRTQIWIDAEIAEHLDAIEPVTMIGCPNGLWDQVNGFPLFRRGVTASHPAIDFQGKSQFALDIGAFGGSSGSPILLLDHGLMREKGTNNQRAVTRFGLLGTLWGRAVVQTTGDVEIVPVPTTSKAVVRLTEGLHLGYAVKARETLALLDQLEAAFEGQSA